MPRLTYQEWKKQKGLAKLPIPLFFICLAVLFAFIVRDFETRGASQVFSEMALYLVALIACVIALGFLLFVAGGVKARRETEEKQLADALKRRKNNSR